MFESSDSFPRPSWLGLFFFYFWPFFNCRQPPSEFDSMALSGTLLPSISTFASGADVKHKAIMGHGTANLVSIKQVMVNSHALLAKFCCWWDEIMSSPHSYSSSSATAAGAWTVASSSLHNIWHSSACTDYLSSTSHWILFQAPKLET